MLMVVTLSKDKILKCTADQLVKKCLCHYLNISYITPHYMAFDNDMLIIIREKKLVKKSVINYILFSLKGNLHY